MVVLMVFATFVLSILVLGLVSVLRTRRAIRQSVDVAAEGASREIFWHPGHTWISPLSDLAVKIGIDAFALRLVGRVDQVKLPAEGVKVNQGEHLMALRQGTRWVAFKAPVSGTVRRVNHQSEPAANSAYSTGWICEMDLERPPAAGFPGLIQASAVKDWLAREVQRVIDLFSLESAASPRLVTALPDGGTLVDGLLETVDDTDWRRVTDALFEAPGE